MSPSLFQKMAQNSVGLFTLCLQGRLKIIETDKLWFDTLYNVSEDL